MTKTTHSVLIVDDERGARESLRLILEPHFRVLTADSGELALEILKRENVSVMTLDLRMPGLSGPETLLKIREIDSELEVVIVTAFASYAEAMRALRLSAFDLVSKPFEPSKVLETVRRAAARCETHRREPAHEILEGLANRLLEAVRGLSESESRSLSESGRVTLDDIRAQARTLLTRLNRAPKDVSS
jgi:DNA-binding NtrC family response regulator